MRNRVFLKFQRLTIGVSFTLLLVAPVAADEKSGIHTSREGRSLPLAVKEDMFHFVVFGDRTGGPAEGIKVLEQAVVETNLLDPDLVLVAYCLNDNKISGSVEMSVFRDDENWSQSRELVNQVAKNSVLRSHLIRLVWYRLSLLKSTNNQSKSSNRESENESITWTLTGSAVG